MRDKENGEVFIISEKIEVCPFIALGLMAYWVATGQIQWELLLIAVLFGVRGVTINWRQLFRRD